MSKQVRSIRMCSSGSSETSDSDILQSDDLDAYTTAYIRRFCESIGSLLETDRPAPKSAGDTPSEKETLARV